MTGRAPRPLRFSHTAPARTLPDYEADVPDYEADVPEHEMAVPDYMDGWAAVGAAASTTRSAVTTSPPARRTHRCSRPTGGSDRGSGLLRYANFSSPGSRRLRTSCWQRPARTVAFTHPEQAQRPIRCANNVALFGLAVTQRGDLVPSVGGMTWLARGEGRGGEKSVAQVDGGGARQLMAALAGGTTRQGRRAEMSHHRGSLPLAIGIAVALTACSCFGRCRAAGFHLQPRGAALSPARQAWPGRPQQHV